MSMHKKIYKRVIDDLYHNINEMIARTIGSLFSVPNSNK